MIGETTGAALITKGVFVPPGKQPPEGERKIYLLIEGPTELSVKHAKQASVFTVRSAFLGVPDLMSLRDLSCLNCVSHPCSHLCCNAGLETSPGGNHREGHEKGRPSRRSWEVQHCLTLASVVVCRQ